jgi:hypothetical protein
MSDKAHQLTERDKHFMEEAIALGVVEGRALELFIRVSVKEIYSRGVEMRLIHNGLMGSEWLHLLEEDEAIYFILEQDRAYAQQWCVDLDCFLKWKEWRKRSYTCAVCRGGPFTIHDGEKFIKSCVKNDPHYTHNGGLLCSREKEYNPSSPVDFIAGIHDTCLRCWCKKETESRKAAERAISVVQLLAGAEAIQNYDPTK